ncbi:MAG TPA: extracellular solute-binding protein, partial [Candidatus Dormibacteraeota bacterium]|nr:extracellular solute-binding protein [Candidatus Dormibacteraeota bacterium]
YVNGRWLGWVDFYIAIMPIVRTDLVQQYGFSLDKLKTWNDYMNMAAVGKSNGHAAGLAISHCNDSNHNWRAVMYSFGASIVEADGKTIAVDKPEFRQFLEFAQEFYSRANTPEVFAWDDASDNRWLDSGQGIYIHDAISSMRSVESTNPDLYKNLALMPPEAGPAHPDGLTVVDPNCYVIWKWSKNQQAAKEFLKHYIDNYHEAFLQSQLYNMPTHANPWKNQLWTDPAYGGKWAEPKLAPLQQVRGDRIAVFGYPGNPNYAANQVLAQYILPDTVATAVKTPGSAGIDAALKFIKQKLNTIYVS